MKRRWMRYLAALLLTVLSAAGARGEGYQRVVYEGVEYEYNPQVTAILYAGVDSDGEMWTTDRYTIAPRADTINLIVLDGYHTFIVLLLLSAVVEPQRVCKFRAMVLTTSSMTIGLDRWLFMPASRDACTSSAKALAVIAMMGMVRPSGRPSRLRIARVAS